MDQLVGENGEEKTQRSEQTAIECRKLARMWKI